MAEPVCDDQAAEPVERFAMGTAAMLSLIVTLLLVDLAIGGQLFPKIV